MVRVSARSSWPRRVLPAFLLFLCFSSVSLFPFQLLNDCRHPAKFGTWKFDWREGESGNSARLDWTNNTRNYLIRRTEFICLCDFHWFSLSLDFPFSDSVLLRTISPVDGRFGSAGVRYEKRGGNIQRKLRYTYTVAVKNRNIWLSPWSFWVFILSNIKKMTTNSFSRRLWILLIIRLSDENGYDRRRSSQEVMGRFKGNKQRSRKKRGERGKKKAAWWKGGCCV